MRSFLRLEEVSKRLGASLAVDRVTVEVAEGEVLTLFGPSGCGKTTLLRLVAGLESPDAGRILLGGKCVADGSRNLTPPHRRGIGFVFQDLALWPHMTVAENLQFALSSSKLPKEHARTRIVETLRLTRVERYAASHPHQLSGGEQQRVALARALVAHPKLLLLDEPMSSLDGELKKELLNELEQLQRRVGVTTIHVTHDRAEAEVLAHRIAAMSKGRITSIEANRTSTNAAR